MQRDITSHTDGTHHDTRDTSARTNRRSLVSRKVPVILALVLITGLSPTFASAEPSSNSCWGQASAAYARLAPGTMGTHAAAFETPRIGLRNLARSLELDSMAELGAFVVDAEGLEVPACE
jgi:hypothetical protein